MPAEGVASSPAAATPSLPASAGLSPALGITAFALAAMLAIAPDILTALAPGLTAANPRGVVGLLSVASLLPFVLGIVAAVTRRGRYWGIAAITLAALANYLVFALVNVVNFYLGSPGSAL